MSGKFVFGGIVGLAGFVAGALYSDREWAYRYVAMPITSCMDPERAHRTSIWLASKGIVPVDSTIDPPILVRLG